MALNTHNFTLNYFVDLSYTQKCRFMGKEVREISHFFVAPPREFPLSIWRVSRTSFVVLIYTPQQQEDVVAAAPPFCFCSFFADSCLLRETHRIQPISEYYRLHFFILRTRTSLLAGLWLVYGQIVPLILLIRKMFGLLRIALDLILGLSGSMFECHFLLANNSRSPRSTCSK